MTTTQSIGTANPLMTRYPGTWWQSLNTAHPNPAAVEALRMSLAAGLKKNEPTTPDATTADLKAFQKLRNLPETGTVDAATARALNMNTIMTGDRGPQVEELRAGLEKLGFKFNPKADRQQFDSELASAVKTFQESRKPALANDSIVGMNTRFALAKALRKGEQIAPAQAQTSKPDGSDITNRRIDLGDIVAKRPYNAQTVNGGDTVTFSLPIQGGVPSSVELDIKQRGPDGQLHPLAPGDALQVQVRNGRAQYTLKVPRDWQKSTQGEVVITAKNQNSGTVRLLIPPATSQVALQVKQKEDDAANRTPVFGPNPGNTQKITEALNQLPNDLRAVLVQNCFINTKVADMSTSPNSQAAAGWQRRPDGKYDIFLGNTNFYTSQFKDQLEWAAKRIQKDLSSRTRAGQPIAG